MGTAAHVGEAPPSTDSTNSNVLHQNLCQPLLKSVQLADFLHPGFALANNNTRLNWETLKLNAGWKGAPIRVSVASAAVQKFHSALSLRLRQFRDSTIGADRGVACLAEHGHAPCSSRNVGRAALDARCAGVRARCRYLLCSCSLVSFGDSLITAVLHSKAPGLYLLGCVHVSRRRCRACRAWARMGRLLPRVCVHMT
jgi:hypothetical protein